MSTIQQILAAIGSPPPTDPYYNSVSLLLHGEGNNGSSTFTDSSSFGVVGSSLNSALISTAQFRYGSASINFPGGTTAANSSRVEYTSSSSIFALLPLSVFTIEASVYLTGDSIRSSSNGTLGNRVASIINSNFTSIAPVSAYWWVLSGSSTVTGTGMQYTTWDSASTLRTITWVFPATLNKNQWYDLAICRSGGSWYAFLDGSLLSGPATNTLAATTQTQASGTLRIGSTPWQNGSGGTLNNFSAGLTGYIDELRITKNVARYTSSYTPTGPFPNMQTP